MALYLAIDAGGTKTRCMLANEERVLARAEAGTVKLMRVGEAEATSRLHAVLAEVATIAGVSLVQVQRACFGLAGSRSESVEQWALRAVVGLVGGELVVCGDEEIALDAAFSGGAGILVIAGTGSNVVGRGDDGTLFNAGGWGPVLGDEGSGYWIGLEAVRAALQARGCGDDVAAIELLREIELEWGVGTLGELVALGNLRAPCKTAAPPDFATLAPMVARCADGGNELARSVLRRAGEVLAEFVTQVFKRMVVAGSIMEGKPVEVAYTGSILKNIPIVREEFIGRLRIVVPKARVRKEAVDPLEGALWRARKGQPQSSL